MYNRPINYAIQWGSSGVLLKPTVEKTRTGWNGNEKPLVEHMNWILNRIDGAIGYFLQGAVEWGNEVDYPAGKIVAQNGVFYRSKSDIPASLKVTIDNTEYWEQAFYSTTSGESLAEEIRKIKEVDGYLSKYLTVSNPTTTARVKAGSYEADVGLPTQSFQNVGYSFKGAVTTGMYLSNTNIAFNVGGATRASIPTNVPALSDKSTTIATTDWVQRLLDEKIGAIDITANRLPVGSVFITISEQNPNALLGYGTWVRFAEGEVIVGKSTQQSSPSWTKTVLNEYGEYDIKLNESQVPKHYHFTFAAQWNGGDISEANNTAIYASRTSKDYNGYVIGGTSVREPTLGKTSSFGGDGFHNNVQPSIVANIWRRTA